MGRGLVGDMIQDDALGTVDPVTEKVKIETRSQRVNLLIKPSTLKKVKVKCKKSGRSVNDVINILLEDWVSRP